MCIVNTHLFYHPYAPHIRTMHTAAILEEACAEVEKLRLQPPPAMVFCGDLNSDLNDGIPGECELRHCGARVTCTVWALVLGVPRLVSI